MLSITDTLGLFFVWWILSMSVLPENLLGIIMPIAMGLAVAYRWRLMRFKMITHLAFVAIDIVAVCVVAFVLFVAFETPERHGGLAGTSGAVAYLTTHRIEAGLAAAAMIAIASVVGRVIFAPKRIQ